MIKLSELQPPGHAIDSQTPEERGLLYRALRMARLADDTSRGLRRRVLAFALLSWLPLLLLTTAERNLLDGSAAVPFVRDVEAHVRFLIVIPLLLIAEVEARRILPLLVREFPRRGLIPAPAMPRFEAAIASAYRVRNSVWAELVLIGLAYGVFIAVVWRQYGATYAVTWYASSSAAGSQLTLAGYWYLLVSLPLVQFLLLRWYLWIVIWARFLWQVSRIELNLTPTHPDRAGGLGFLQGSGYLFTTMAIAIGAVMAGPIASQILFKGAALPDFADEIVLVAAFVVCAALGPLLFFAPQLRAAKKTGLLEYGRLGNRYVREFHAKWVGGSPPADEPLVGSADIQSLADMGGAYEIVEGMRLVPANYTAPVHLAVATLIPVAPLLLTMIPLNELAQKLFTIVL
jgi:hypothetical protein